MTAIVAISAAGDVVPLFLIVEYQNMILNWFGQLTLEELNQNTIFWWLTYLDWFPRKGVVVMSKNRSMKMKIIEHLVQHINRYV